jgi:DNA-binding NarL/FixJ family response regulator
MSIVELSNQESGLSAVNAPPQRYRMFVIDDQQLVVDGLVEWVNLNAVEFDVVGTTGLWAEYLDHSWYPGDVVLMTAAELLDSNDALARVKAIREAGAEVVAITSDGSPAGARLFLAAGASAVVSRSQPAAELIGAARNALATSANGSSRAEEKPVEVLTNFDAATLAILRLYATGHSTVDISVSTGTKFELVRSTLQQIRSYYEGTGRQVVSRDDLVRRAAEDGLLAES